MKNTFSLPEILTHPEVRGPLESLKKLGISDEHLSAQIWLLLSVPPKMPLLVERRSDRRTKLLPRRLENMADEIQQINERSGLLYEMALRSFAEERRTLLNTAEVGTTRHTQQGIDYCRSLPLMIRTYAGYLRYAFKMNRKGWSELHDLAICRFQIEIKKATGNYHDKHVASLLSAAFRAAGHDKTADRLNENQLKSLRHRNKKLFS